jgi:excisionase family DNA binding protein
MTDHPRGVPAGGVRAPDVLTVREVAARLQCCAETVKKLIRAGDLPARDIGTAKRPEYRVPIVLFDRWLANGRAADEPSAPPSPTKLLHTRAPRVAARAGDVAS